MPSSERMHTEWTFHECSIRCDIGHSSSLELKYRCYLYEASLPLWHVHSFLHALFQYRNKFNPNEEFRRVAAQFADSCRFLDYDWTCLNQPSNRMLRETPHVAGPYTRTVHIVHGHLLLTMIFFFRLAHRIRRKKRAKAILHGLLNHFVRPEAIAVSNFDTLLAEAKMFVLHDNVLHGVFT